MIYVIRHGETDGNVQGILRGSYFDDELNQIGIKQTKNVAKQLKDIKFDACYCSPMKRTLQTCEQIYSGEKILDKRLLPRDYGKLVGKAPEELDDIGFWNRDENLTSGNGESFSNLESRVESVLDELHRKHSRGNVLVVTHGSIAAMINGVEQNFSRGPEIREYTLGNCEILKIPN